MQEKWQFRWIDGEYNFVINKNFRMKVVLFGSSFGLEDIYKKKNKKWCNINKVDENIEKRKKWKKRLAKEKSWWYDKTRCDEMSQYFHWILSKKQQKMLTIVFTRDSINELRVKHIAAKNLDNQTVMQPWKFFEKFQSEENT